MSDRDRLLAEARDTAAALRDLTNTLKIETPHLVAATTLWYWELRAKVA